MTASLVATKSVALPLDVKAGETPGTFEGYGAVFGNRDRDGDIVSPGAFAESLKGGMPALLWQHDQKAPIGKFDEVREDERGLFVKGRLSLTGRGAEAYDLLKMGALNGLSIGFVTKEATRDPATSTRTITKADLMEVSLVTFPANEEARVSSVKSFDLNPAGDARAFERMLRENGFSRSRAKAITAKGFKAADMGMDETQDVAGLIDSLKASQLRLEEKRVRQRISVHKGRKVTKDIMYKIDSARKRLTITPKEQGVDFTATAYYHFWSSRGPQPKTAEFRWANDRGINSRVLAIREKDASLVERLLGDRGPRKYVGTLKLELFAKNKSSAFEVELT